MKKVHIYDSFHMLLVLIIKFLSVIWLQRQNCPILLVRPVKCCRKISPALRHPRRYRKNYILNFNRIDRKKLNMRLLHQHIGYSSQSSYIFHDAIKINICLYDEYSDNEMNHVLEIVGLSKEIVLLENGLETVINENIKNLSGGQLQRIALARVLIRKYNMLILDEVTSSLDPETTK